MAGSIQVPLTITASGPVPTPPATLRSTLVTEVGATNPDYTANLPGSLIEDIASTETGGLAMIDQMRVDALQAAPIVANQYLTVLLGQQAGIPQGAATNTSADVVFSTPTSGAGSAIGFVIPAGFTVSDGTHQYVVQDGTIIGSDGSSPQVTVVATQSGSWAVPAGTVTQVITSVPSPYTITVTNPQAGIPAQTAETIESYQARVIQAGQAAAIGTVPYLKTLLQAVSGVVPRLISVQQAGTGWKVIVGGGDAYQVANAIYLGVLDLASLVGSSTPDRNVSVSIVSPPDTYTVLFVNPPAQIVTGTVTWNTNLPNFTSGPQVNSLAAPALVSYINSILQGQPINELEMTAAFQDAVASVLPAANLTTLTFAININGVLTPPNTGTSIIPGDSESYFSAADNAFTIQQG